VHVVIAGASGLIGSALSASLRADGHRVVTLVRRKARTEDESSWDPARGVIDAQAVAAADAVVNLAGASIGDKRLTDAYKLTVLQSRLDTTSLLARTVADVGPAVWVQGSAMGYYGDRGTEALTEDMAPGDTFLADIVTQWEAAAQPAVDAGVRVAFSRTGLVMSDHGGFAARLIPLVKRGLLRSLGSGDALHSWIALEDAVAALRHLVVTPVAGPVNVIAPTAVADRDLIAAMTHAWGKTPGIGVPGWALRLAIGEAVVDLLTSQNGVPARLTETGFTWRYGTIDAAAQHVAELSRAR